MATTKKTSRKTSKTAKATAKATAKKTAKKSGGGGGAKDDARAETLKAFKHYVNMTPAAVEKFLKSKESRKVGFKTGGVGGTGESVGHASGRKIIAIKGKKAADLSPADVKHMAKVVGYIKRHCAQGPDKKADVADSKWRASLMNWGHDPMKGRGCGPG